MTPYVKRSARDYGLIGLRRARGSNTFVSTVPAGSSSYEGDDHLGYFVAVSGSSSQANSMRGAKFAALHEALVTLSRFPAGHSFHLDEGAARRASDLVGVIAKNLAIDPPRLFPQDGEAAVLTWDVGDVKRLLTVDSEDADLMDINRKTLVRCDHVLPEAPDMQLEGILRELAGQAGSFSNSSADLDV